MRPFKGIICHDISEFEFTCPAMQSGLYQPTCRLDLNSWRHLVIRRPSTKNRCPSPGAAGHRRNEPPGLRSQLLCPVGAHQSAPLPRGITLGIGDIVSVTIFEPPGGLFVPSDAGARPGNFVTLPNQIVDSDGNITVPYAGTIPAAGRTPSEVQQAIN